MIEFKSTRFFKFITNMIIILFLCSSEISPSFGDNIHMQFERAKNEYSKGNYFYVIRRLERLIASLDKKDREQKNLLAKTYLLVGAAYEKSKNMKKAKKNYIESCKLWRSPSKVIIKDGVIEQSRSFPIIKGIKLDDLKYYRKYIIERCDKKKFPWLLVIGGVVVVGIILFIVLKKKTKKYTLTVNIEKGVLGGPLSGTYTYKEGVVVNYNYSAAIGYTDPNVFLDGSPVPSSGSITMNDNHTLSATSEERDYAQEVYNSIEWIQIPAGEFKMGDNFNEGEPDERPVHNVYLDTYYISKYEVTFAQYDSFCEATGRSKPEDFGWGRGTRPVILITWDDAKAFCDWLSTKTGKNIHLPTEAQWEKAARGTNQRRFPWGNEYPSCSLTNYYYCKGKTMPVGSCPSGVSPYGVHDMAGNVWEFCSDWKSSTYYSISPYKNPTGPSIGSSRVVRGGCWYNGATYLRCANRASRNPDEAFNSLGFRLASPL